MKAYAAAQALSRWRHPRDFEPLDFTALAHPSEIELGVEQGSRVRCPGAGRPSIESSQPGVKEALEKLVDPVTRGDPCSALRWTCKSRAKLTGALVKAGWRVSSTTVGRLLHELGYSLQSVRKSKMLSSISSMEPLRVTSTCRVTLFPETDTMLADMESS